MDGAQQADSPSTVTREHLIEGVYDGKGTLSGYALCSLVSGMRMNKQKE